MMPLLQLGPNGLSAYNLFNALAFCAALLCNFCFLGREYALLEHHPFLFRFKKAADAKQEFALLYLIVFTVVQFVFGVIWSGLWGSVTKISLADYFGTAVWSPIFPFLFFLLLRIDPVKQMDLIAPAYAASLILFKIACFFAGCCHGKPWQYGLYFVKREQYEFPSQLLEAFTALLILIVLVALVRKGRLVGRIYPTYLILYSTTRFFTEFTRANEVVWLGLQFYQLQCIGGVLIGLLAFWLLTKFGPGLSARFTYAPADPPSAS